MPDTEYKRAGADPQPFGVLARVIVLRGILAAMDSPSEMKDRVIIAWQDGHLTDDQAVQIIAVWGLKEA